MNRPLLPLIRQRYPTMSPTEKKIAACILEDPETVINETVTHLARRAATASSSVANFAQGMGFRGFTDMKIALARSLEGVGAVSFDDVTAEDDPRQAMRKMIVNAQDSFESTYTALGDELQQAADLLMGASRIEIYASGSSLPVAYDVHYRLMRLGLPAVILPEPLLACISASHLTEGSVVVAISHKGRTANTVTAARTAREHGAKVIALTSFRPSPLADMSDVCLVSVSGEALAYREAVISRLTQLLMVDSLCAYIAAQQGTEAVKFLDSEIEVLEYYRKDEQEREE